MKYISNWIAIEVIELDVHTADAVCNSLARFSVLKLRRKLQHALLSVIYFGSLFAGFRWLTEEFSAIEI